MLAGTPPKKKRNAKSAQGFTPLQILNLIEGYDVVAWGDGTADYYHHIAEAVKIAFADREEWLTDPRVVEIPVQRLISKEYCNERRKLIDPERALDIAKVPPVFPIYTHMNASSPMVIPAISVRQTRTGRSRR